MEEKDFVGIILSGATTSEATCQLLKHAERGGIREGMLLIVKSDERKILSRVSQIVPYNAFYTEGDTWSEARREGKQIPEEVARQYEISKLELLLEIPRKEIVYPPRPGDKVFKIDLKTDMNYEEDLFCVSGERKISKGIYKGIIKFGSLGGYKKLPVTLDVEKIPMHLAVFGVTGSGKSFNTGYLIEKLMEIPKDAQTSVSYPMIIIDAHGDYIDFPEYFNNRTNEWMKCGWIRRFVFPNIYLADPKLRRKEYIEPIGINLNLINSSELAELIVTYLKGSTEGADQQISCLVSLFDELTRLGYSINDLIIDEREKIEEKLDEVKDEKSFSSQTIEAVKRQLNEFYKLEDNYKLFSEDSKLKQQSFVDEITRNRGLAIIDFSAEGAPGVDLKTKQFVVSYLATILFEKFTEYKLKGSQKYLLLIIEEAQNFCPDKSYPIPTSLAKSKLSAIATQGRKFGLSLCLISQRPSFVDRIILSMCNTFFIHRISPEDVDFVKSVSGGLPSSLARRLTTLSTGDVIISGQMLTVPFPVLVRVSKEDRKIIPEIGGTNVMENL
ncbi:MAG: ATP-binding protein [Candidatus Aenigmatarchaeota archaeon]